MIAAVDTRFVVVEGIYENPALPGRFLDLHNIATPQLSLLSPTEKEVSAIQADVTLALTLYADRLRESYRKNETGLRDGLKLLSETSANGQSIKISCSCNAGEMCHSDVVKMAVEKVAAYRERQFEAESHDIKGTRPETSPKGRVDVKSHDSRTVNPRTARAVTEILGVTQNDRLLESINQTSGRSRSEQASHLGRSSQFVRDLYERGANLVDGNLIVPTERPTVSQPIRVSTQEYAVSKVTEILKQKVSAKELAPLIVEYGNKIAGPAPDGETKVKVFTWMYQALEGKAEFLAGEQDPSRVETKEDRFARSLEEIRILADEMHELAPTDKLELQPLRVIEESGRVIIDEESLALEQLYDEAISRNIDEPNYTEQQEEPVAELAHDKEVGTAANSSGFERIELASRTVPQIPSDMGIFVLDKLLESTLPELDRQLENGTPVNDILRPYRDRVYQSAKDDALNKLETIYKLEKITEIEQRLSDASQTSEAREKDQAEISRWQNAILTPTQEEIRQIILEHQEIDHLQKARIANPRDKAELESRLTDLRERDIERRHLKETKTITQLSENPRDNTRNLYKAIEAMDIRKPFVISLSTPADFRKAQGAAEDIFQSKKKIEISSLREEMSELRAKTLSDATGAPTTKQKKELNDLLERNLSVVYKLENSEQKVTGKPSEKAVEELRFAGAYIGYQLKQPESRFRHENERYRSYAAKLEKAQSRTDLMDAASEIRAENASHGLNWKTLGPNEKQAQLQPLSVREMQFLFTEVSPAHYTSEMTVTRLAYAHAGASRRLTVGALIKGDIQPSPEAQKLVASLESRLGREELKDSIAATKHFFQSIKTPNADLRYKNPFDLRETYQKLPPSEKDYVYQLAVLQKENLEYRQIFQAQQPLKAGETAPATSVLAEVSEAEKRFHLLTQFNQARLLGNRIPDSDLHSRDIQQSELNAIAIVLKSNSVDSVNLVSGELRKSNASDDRRAAEMLETIANARFDQEGRQTIITITLPESRIVEIDTYKELLEKLHPDDDRENEKYKLANFGRKMLEETRARGQNETIQNWISNLGEQNALADPSEKVFDPNGELRESLLAIRQLQDGGRVARAENEALIGKYISRAVAKLEKQKQSIPPIEKRKVLAAIAFGGTVGSLASELRSSNLFFRAIQNEITISDFRRHQTNEEQMSQNTSRIRDIFENVSQAQEIADAVKTKSLIMDRPETSSVRLDQQPANVDEMRTGNETTNKVALLRERVSSDILDLLKHESDKSGSNIAQQTAEIIERNLEKLELTKVVRDGESIIQLSREIGERIDGPRQTPDKENSKGTHDQAGIHLPGPKDRGFIRDAAGLPKSGPSTENTVHSR